MTKDNAMDPETARLRETVVRFSAAQSNREKCDAVQEMLKAADALCDAVADAIGETNSLEESDIRKSNEINPRMADLLDDAPDISDTAADVLGIVLQGVEAKDFLLTGRPGFYKAHTDRLTATYIGPHVAADYFAAADMTLQYITADLLDDHPVAVPTTTAYARKLAVCPPVMGIFSRDPGENNQDESVSLLKDTIKAADRHVLEKRLAPEYLAEALAMKYDILEVLCEMDPEKYEPQRDAELERDKTTLKAVTFQINVASSTAPLEKEPEQQQPATRKGSSLSNG